MKKKYIPKLEEMLNEKLRAQFVNFRKMNEIWMCSFLIDSTKKYYVFKTAVKKYGGKIIKYSFQKIP